MLCQKCGTEYQRMSGVKAFKKDYGYCSIECLSSDKAPCPNCGNALNRYLDEKLSHYATRQYCSHQCGASHANRHPKSEETRKRMVQAMKERPAEVYQKIQRSRRAFVKSPAGKAHFRQLRSDYEQWRKDNPDKVAEMTLRQTATRKARGVYEASRQERLSFFQTKEGEIRKEQYRQLYKSKPRPPHVTQKMKESLRRFWDSPQGWQLREEISQSRMEGHSEAPFGPGWQQKAAKIRKRDGCCRICMGRNDSGRRVLDVHHIYARRKFGYIPGQNKNYLWANHPFNLISLCQVCHGQVELGTVLIPADYQAKANSLWQEFIQHPELILSD